MKDKFLDKDIQEFLEKAKMLNDNSEAIHSFLMEAIKERDYTKAFLYFYFEFELFLKHLITSEMQLRNMFKYMKDKNDKNIPYSNTRINKIIKEEGFTLHLNEFCNLFGEEIKKDLEHINRRRHFLIHKMLKEKITKKEIEQNFKDFFKKPENATAMTRCYKFFLDIINSRPQKIIQKLKMTTQLNNKII